MFTIYSFRGLGELSQDVFPDKSSFVPEIKKEMKKETSMLQK